MYVTRWGDATTQAYHVRWGGERIYEIVHPITTQVKREREEIGLSLGGQEQVIGWASVGMSLHLKKVNDTIVGIQRTIALLTLGAIVLGIAVTAVLVKIIVRPIKELVGATTRIAHGELGFKVEVAAKDELGDLATSFNRMARALRQRDLENARLFHELEATNRRLEAASRHKSQFLANMSHELRTPLNSIIGFSEVLLDEAFTGLSPAERREFLANILSSGRHLLGLINDILDLSKIEAGRIELIPEALVVAEVVDGVLQTIRPLAAKKRISVDVALDPTLTTLVADPAKVKQILYNLLSNAMKFTPDGGRAGLRVTYDQREVHFAVWDTGIGITHQDQTRIFEEFQQVETSAARPYEGTGLGLSLAKKFVELHGGSIWVESEPGQGSTFSFILPYVTRPSAAVAERPDSAEANGPLALVVDDDPKARDLLRVWLAREGFAWKRPLMVRKPSARRALQPCLITLDIILPGQDGWEVLRQLKEDVVTRDIPVLVVSIMDEPARGFSLGAADYLLKPFDRDDLLRRLRRFGVTTGAPPESTHILLIDDDRFAVDALTAMLEPEGFRVSKAYGGQQGLEMAMAQAPDLMVVDLLMPEVSGFDVLQRVKEHPDAGGARLRRHCQRPDGRGEAATQPLSVGCDGQERLCDSRVLEGNRSTYALQGCSEGEDLRWQENASCWWKITRRTDAWRSSSYHPTAM